MNKALQEFLYKKADLIANQEGIKRKEPSDCVIGLAFEDGHIHTHTTDKVDDIVGKITQLSPPPVEEKTQFDGTEFVVKTVAEAVSKNNLGDVIDKPCECIKEEPKVPDQVIFRNRQAIGDILTMTCGVRDFKKAFPDTKVQVQTTAMHIWDNNPHIDHGPRFDIEQTKIGPGILTNASNRLNLHMCNAYRMSMEDALGIPPIPQGDIRPDIWMTEEEFNRPPIIDGEYWVIIVGGEPGWTAKMYPADRWQEVVDSLPNIQFVQLGVKSHPFQHLSNVKDLIGTTEDRNTGIRDLFNIFMHAQGSVGLVSMHMHLSAAFNNPCVVAAGAREPMWFTHYMGHQYLQTNGLLPCAEKKACWKCDVKGCPDQTDGIPKCIDIIGPHEISAAINKYYAGGRLKHGEKKKIDFKNIVKEKKVFQVPAGPVLDKDLVDYGFAWGGGSITDRDWDFIEKTIDKYNVKTVLEFGAGISSLLMARKVDSVITYETSQTWIEKIGALAPNNLKIEKWDGQTLPIDFPEKFDMVFVDGPAGGESREWSMKIASMLSDIVMVHDAGRKPERKWQETYLKDTFNLTKKGGHRCHLWTKKKKKVPKGKVARMLTTCRGYGGSERSTIMIMGMLQEKGYDVELVPFGNVCNEYHNNIPEGVEICPWDSIPKPADISVMYCSDSIWNFKEEKWIKGFSEWNSKRRVMILNYQLGGAGKVEWTKGWDQYMFLNSTKKDEFRDIYPAPNTKVLAPPTDLTNFFRIQPDYNTNLRLIRHNSQGDAKHPDYTDQMINDVLKVVPDAEFYYMPAKSDMAENLHVYKYKRNEVPVYMFLEKGNCFWYHLPPKYQDQGPRVILEALASGLPVIADNRYGARDRVNEHTGWLCDTYEDYLEVIGNISPADLKSKGEAAREFASKEFDPYRWVEEIIG